MIATLALCATTVGLIYACIRLRTARYQVQRANLWRSHWRAKALEAQCRLDVIHQQHVDAGKAAHAPWKAKRAETTEALRQCVAARDEIPARAQQPGKRTDRCGISESADRTRGALSSPALGVQAPRCNRAVQSIPADIFEGA